ncbi:uncharacterized protein [Choristoneura fumiferana]|uniref:uncharacterized protein n=1 Tax=Choristoneura fumiferana TaxID=7141 RepID=UPI003D15AF25
MTKILCLLLIAVLAAQICARPDDKDDDKAKAAEGKAKEDADKGKDAGDKAKGDAEKTAKDIKDKVVDAKNAGDADDDDDNEAAEAKAKADAKAKAKAAARATADCEEPFKKAKNSIIPKTATALQAFADDFFEIFE